MQFNFWQRLVAKAVLWALFGPELPAECRVDRAICQTNKMLKNFKPNEQKEIARGVLNFTYADVNAAGNILRAGHARLACEVSGAVIPPAAGTLKAA